MQRRGEQIKDGIFILVDEASSHIFRLIEGALLSTDMDSVFFCKKSTVCVCV